MNAVPFIHNKKNKHPLTEGKSFCPPVREHWGDHINFLARRDEKVLPRFHSYLPGPLAT
jgi:hypothetical protein